MTAMATAYQDQEDAAREHLSRALEGAGVDLHRGLEAWHEGVCEAIRLAKETPVLEWANWVRDEALPFLPALQLRWYDAPETAWVLTLDDNDRVSPPVDFDQWLRANRPAPTRAVRCAWCNGSLPEAQYQHLQVVVSDLTFVVLPNCNRC